MKRVALVAQKPRFTRAGLERALSIALKNRCSEAYLFGSYARNEAHQHSDVDLIVVADSSRPIVERFKDFFDIVLQFAPIDLIVYSRDEWRRLKTKPNPLVKHARREWRKLPLT